MSAFVSGSLEFLGFLLVSSALVAAGYFNQARYVVRYRVVVVLPYILLLLAFSIALALEKNEPYVLFSFLSVLALVLQMICSLADKWQRRKQKEDSGH